MQDTALKQKNIEIAYDGEITIATAASRKSKRWKNRQLTWSDFLKKLSKTRRTGETAAEYKAFPKSKQDEIKDVGGFVGGTLKEGRRTAESVQWRSVITLDADFAEKDLWDSLIFTLGDYACCIYSTHKHSPQKPRVRLILPLSRPVTPDEYQAISRLVANDIGIDQFDDTTYQPHRLMYFPSTSQDGEYIFKYNDSAWLDADEQLERYQKDFKTDWTDQSYWPTSSRVHEDIRKAVSKQEDPLAKKGIIGAFCRTYDIHEAIAKFLADVYEPCGMNRYTYKEGSTSAGAIVYDDKFLYSHHSTDPAGGKLLNAFDLVRIHKYRNLDEDAAEGTPTGRLPSYKAMQDLAMKDSAVKETIGKEKMAQIADEFTEVSDEDIKNLDTKWTASLDVNRWGRYESTPHNIKLILENDPNLKSRFAVNEFSHRICIIKPLIWRKDKKNLGDWTDFDDSCLRNYLSDVYGIAGENKIKDARNEIVSKNSFNPLRDYIDSLQWDGKERLDSFFIDYLGAEDTPLVRAMTRKTICAGVARILNPGCKWDYVLTLVGGQGIGKSNTVKRLGKKWSSDSLVSVVGKEGMEQIQGFWVIEIAELSALRKAEAEQVKHFITKTEDSFRPSYGKNTERYPRQCIFFATTNNRDFIRDQTGGRRWWAIDVDASRRKLNPFEMTEETVDQIWAEAKYRYAIGEKLYLDEAMEQEAKKIQEQHTEESPLAGMIREFIEKEIPENWPEMSIGDRQDFIRGDSFEYHGELVKRDRVCALEIWVELLQGDVKKLTRATAIEINDVLRKTDGWKPSKNKLVFNYYGRQRGFVRS